MSFRALGLAVALSLMLLPPGDAIADDTDQVDEGRGPSKRRRAPRRAPKEAPDKPEEPSAAEAPSQSPEKGDAEPSPAKPDDAESDDGGPKTRAGDDAPEGDAPAEKPSADDAPEKSPETPSEPTPPSEPAEPSSPAQPNKPTEPTEPNEPAEPEEPAEPPAPKPPPPPAQAPPTVSLKDLSFVGGEVARAERFITRAQDDIAQCIHRHGGVAAKQGVLSMQFLVRARGRAEGVEVLARRAISEDGGRCVRRLLKGRWMGSPSQDPVGVTFRLVLTRRLAK